jgi:hypothetical protein
MTREQEQAEQDEHEEEQERKNIDFTDISLCTTNAPYMTHHTHMQTYMLCYVCHMQHT